MRKVRRLACTGSLKLKISRFGTVQSKGLGPATLLGNANFKSTVLESPHERLC